MLGKFHKCAVHIGPQTPLAPAHRRIINFHQYLSVSTMFGFMVAFLGYNKPLWGATIAVSGNATQIDPSNPFFFLVSSAFMLILTSLFKTCRGNRIL